MTDRLPRFAQGVNVLLGLALVAAPHGFGYAELPLATADQIAGPLIVSFAFMSLWRVLRPVRLVCIPLAIGLLGAAALFGGPQGVVIGHVLTALAITLLALPGGYDPGRYGGGWSILWRE